MKEPLSFSEGRVVRSTQGRDRGRHFLVTQRVDEKYVLIADGLTHRLAAPKKKKTMHLHACPVEVDLSTLRPEGGPLQDSDIRRALDENGFPVKHSLCKEG